MHVADGVEMLEISTNVMGRPDTVNPVLIFDERDAILVDAGFPGQAPAIVAAIESAGVPLERLGNVIITHQDIDHIGSLADVVAAVPGPVQVMASAVEKPYIQGEKPLIKLTPELMARLESMMPPDMAEARREALKAVFENPPRARVDRSLCDGERIRCCGA